MDVAEVLTPRWQEADEAVRSLVATLAAEAARTTGRSGKRPRRRSRPKSTRHHIAEVIRDHRLAPGLRVDRNMVAALFFGHRDLMTNPVLVGAVARACGIIAGRKLSAKKAARFRADSIRVGELLARAEAEPVLVPPQQRAEPPSAAEPASPAASADRLARLAWLSAAVLLLFVLVVLAVL